jgi:hypothetical protein
MAGEVLVAQQTALGLRLQETLIELITRVWRSIPDVSDASLARWLALVVPLVAGAQRQAAQLQAAYLARTVAEMTGQPLELIGVDPLKVTGAVVRQGVPPDVVYARPVIQARSLLGQGMLGAEVFARAEQRAVQLATTDLQLARTHAAVSVLGRTRGVVGYRRVLTGMKSCRLCTLASTQRYHRGELMPIHPGCSCAVAPIIGHQDPGRVLDQPLLEAVNSGDVTVYDHGEYGPTLAKAGDRHLLGADAADRVTVDATAS